MKKKDLKAGMLVRNKVSGHTAQVYPDEYGEFLTPSGKDVFVCLRMGERNRIHYPIWSIKNLEKAVQLVAEFAAYKGKLGYNEWGVRSEDRADCKFPIYRRITELGFQILGMTEEHEHRFRGSKRLGKNWLLLMILPHTDRNLIAALVATIGLETK